jgi:hypothetical protein
MIISALMMEAVSTSETSVNFYETTRRNIPEDGHLHSPGLNNTVYHLNRNPTTITYCGTKIKSEAGPARVNSRETRVKVTLVARPLLTPVAQKLYRCEHGVIHEQNECSFSNITLHRNSLLLFVKSLAMHILRRKYRIRQQYTDW